MDVVLVDAPCSGTGVWRRRPDAKWRLTKPQLAHRLSTQSELLQRAARLLKPKGTLAYITCSLLPAENSKQVKDFLTNNPGFTQVNAKVRAEEILSRPLNGSLADNTQDLLLTPARHGTDGFYIALLIKTGA